MFKFLICSQALLLHKWPTETDNLIRTKIFDHLKSTLNKLNVSY